MWYGYEIHDGRRCREKGRKRYKNTHTHTHIKYTFKYIHTQTTHALTYMCVHTVRSTAITFRVHRGHKFGYIKLSRYGGGGIFSSIFYKHHHRIYIYTTGMLYTLFKYMYVLCVYYIIVCSSANLGNWIGSFRIQASSTARTTKKSYRMCAERLSVYNNQSAVLAR